MRYLQKLAREALNSLRESAKLFFILTLLYLFSTITSIFLTLTLYRGIVRSTAGLVIWATPEIRFRIILSNNLFASAMIYLKGLTIVGAIINLFYESFSLGNTLGMLIERFGIAKALAAIVPHGIIEVPATLLVYSAGIELPIALAKLLLDREDFIDDLRRSFYLLVIGILLLVPAALIEAYITPFIFSQL